MSGKLGKWQSTCLASARMTPWGEWGVPSRGKNEFLRMGEWQVKKNIDGGILTNNQKTERIYY